MFQTPRFTRFLATAASVFLASSAHAVEFDIAPRVDGGKILAIGYSDPLGQFIPDESTPSLVFPYDLGEGVVPFEIDDPGFNAENFSTPTGFAPGSFVGVQLRGDLQYWNGSGAPAFGPVTAGERMQFESGPFSRIAGTNTQTEFDPWFLFEVEDAPHTGEFHGHITSRLLDGNLAAIGIFMVPVGVVNGVADQQSANFTGTVFTDPMPSDTLFWLFNNGLAEDDYEEAVEAFITSLTNGGGSNTAVPEPGSLSLALIALAAAGLRRQRAGSAC